MYILPFEYLLEWPLYLTEMTHVCSFVDDTMFYSCDGYPNAFVDRLKYDITVAVE